MIDPNETHYVCCCAYKECQCNGVCRFRAEVELYDASDTVRRFTARMCVQCAIDAVNRGIMVPVDPADIVQREASIKVLKAEPEEVVLKEEEVRAANAPSDGIQHEFDQELDAVIHSASLRNCGWD